MAFVVPVPKVPIAGDDVASAFQLDQENAGLGDDQGVNLVYRSIISDEFKVGIEEIWIPILQNIAQEVKRLALVRVS